MYIKKIIGENFQKHSYIEINLINGINVIYGDTDAGKSCIRRLIEWVTQNAKIDGIRKTGTKITSGKITLDNDIIIERQKSASINRYIIHENGKETVFDSIGKTIPQEVKDILNLEPINIDGEDIYLNSAPQISLPFLFDRSPTFRMKLFNKLSGNDILDKLFVKFNKDILRIDREHKREEEEVKNQIKELEIIEIKKEKMEVIHKRVDKSIKNLKQIAERHSELSKLSELINNTRNIIKETQENLTNINIPKDSEIKELTDKLERITILNKVKENLDRTKANFDETTDKLKKLNIPKQEEIKAISDKLERLEALRQVENDLERTKTSLNKVRGQLDNFKPLTLDYETLLGKLERIDILKNIKKVLDNTKEQCYTLDIRDKELTKEIITFTEERKKLLKALKICPTCDQEIKL